MKSTQLREHLATLSNPELEHLIDRWIRGERNRSILKRRMIDGIRYAQLAEEFDLSIQRVKRIVYQAQSTLFAHM